MDANAPVLDAIANRIIGCALVVSHTLGSGFLEEIYENTLAIELREAGLAVALQYGISVRYHGSVIGTISRICWLRTRSWWS
jgi:GxxExxY protein